MKKPTILRFWAVLCTLVILSACQKETSQKTKQSISPEETAGVRMTGATPEDPARIAKVPTIMSQEFLSNTQKYMTTPDMLSARGKPVKSGTDAIPPTVSITSPANGSTVSGTVNIQVSATDNVAVSSVSLIVDGTTIGTSTKAPYSFSWTASSGSHTIIATAKDAAGNSATNSITVSQNVVSADVTVPTVSITSPTSGSTVSGSVNVAVSASDNVGVKSVTLSVDGTLVSTLTAAPYNFSWNSTNVADGNHSLTAKAVDAAGNSSLSTISVAKNTTISTPPPSTLPASALLVMPPVGYQGSEGSCVPFAVAYAARSCEQYYRSNSGSYSLSTNIFSPEYVFNQIQAGGCSSSSILTALDFIVGKGVCTWSSMPYSYTNGCSLQPTASQNSEAANYKISSYSKVYTTDITAMKTMIVNKHPLMMTFANDNNFNNAGPGYIWKSYDYAGGFGSHAITICGYDDSKHAYKAINSWGTSWGDGGYIWIDYDFLPSVASTVYTMN